MRFQKLVEQKDTEVKASKAEIEKMTKEKETSIKTVTQVSYDA